MTAPLLDDQRLYSYIDRTLKVLVGRLEQGDLAPKSMKELAEAVDKLCFTVVERENAKIKAPWRED